MSLPFRVLNVSVVLLSRQGQKALEFEQKYLNFFIFGWTIPLNHYSLFTKASLMASVVKSKELYTLSELDNHFYWAIL